jgi:hypothetical protein
MSNNIIRRINQNQNIDYKLLKTALNEPNVSKSLLYSKIANNTDKYNIIQRGIPIINFENIYTSFVDAGTINLTYYTSSNTTGDFSYVSSDPTIMTISGDIGILINTGTVSITIYQLLNLSYISSIPDNYLIATHTGSATIIPSNTPIYIDIIFNNSIIFDDFSCNYGTKPFVLPIDYESPSNITITSSNPYVSTISGNVITPLNAGTSILNVYQPNIVYYINGNTIQYKKVSINTTINVNQIKPTFGEFNQIDVSYNDPPFQIQTITSNSNGAFTYSSIITDVADISKNIIIPKNAGSTVIIAVQTASGNYLSMTKTTWMNVKQIKKPIYNYNILNTVLYFDNFQCNYRSRPFNIPYYTSSPQSITFTSSNTYVATISGYMIIPKNVGRTLITFKQDSYQKNISETKNIKYVSIIKRVFFTVLPITPAISGNIVYDPKTYSDNINTITIPQITSESSGNIHFIIEDTSVASISGNLINFKNSGITNLIIRQDACGNYLSRSIYSKITIQPIKVPIFIDTYINTLIDFDSFSSLYKTSSFLIPATTNSPSKITFISSNPYVATISGNIIIPNNIGRTTITASVFDISYTDSTFNYIFNATSLSVQYSVIPIKPTLQFDLSDIIINYENLPYNITIPSITSNSSGQTHLISTDTTVATISGNYISLNNSGISNIIITQDACANYLSISKYSTITIQPTIVPIYLDFYINSIIQFEDFSLPFNNKPYKLTATTNSPSKITYSSSSTQVSTISEDFIIPHNIGISNITASVMDISYSNGPFQFIYNNASFDVSFSCIPAKPIINGQLNDISRNYTKDVSFIYLPTITSESFGTYSYTSLDNNIATVSNKRIYFGNCGNTLLIFHQDAYGNYYSITTTINVSISSIKVDIYNELSFNTFILFKDISINYNSPSFELSAISNSPAPIVYSSNNQNVATISGTTLIPQNIGTTTITASISDTSFVIGNINNYFSSAIKTIQISVLPIKPTFTTGGLDNYYSEYNDNDSYISLSKITSNSNGQLSFISTESSVASINVANENILLNNCGTTTIIIHQDAYGNYLSKSLYSKIIISPILTPIFINIYINTTIEFIF